MSTSELIKANGTATQTMSPWTPFASVKMTVTLLSLIAATVLVGAWCPQESQGGIQKVIDQFGEEWAYNFSKWGVTDIFHSPWFLGLIGLLTVNMVACSVQRVFPKVRTLRQALPYLKAREISRFPFNLQAKLSLPADKGLALLQKRLQKDGYRVKVKGLSLVAEWGKFGRLAPTIMHIGLLTLLAGVTVTSWTGFSGFQPVALDESMKFGSSEHSRLWIGKLPDWKVRVDKTRRENYASGEAKQWYSDLSVISKQGKVIAKKQISVNDPLSFDGVDIYQSSWAMDHLDIDFNGHGQSLQLRPMGKLYAAFMPLDESTILIFSVRDQGKPLRVFGKTPNFESPRLLCEIEPGKSARLGSVVVAYKRAVPITGLQYKSDPGFPIVFVAFVFIMAGALLAAVPHRQVYAYSSHAVYAEELDASSNRAGQEQPRVLALVGAAIEPGAAQLEVSSKADLNGSAHINELAQNNCILYVGGRSLKARTAFETSLSKIVSAMEMETGETI